MPRSGSWGREATTSGSPLFGSPADGKADMVVAVLLGRTFDEGLLQAVGQDHDPVVPAQLPPHPLFVGVGQQRALGAGQEPSASKLPREEAVLSVPQPDRYRHGAVFGQHLSELDQQRGLARPDAADDHVGAAGAGVGTGPGSSRDTARPGRLPGR